MPSRLMLSVIIAVTLGGVGCTRHPLRNPVGERFPTVTGRSLAGESVRFPDVVAGRRAVLIVAFEQDAQFDVDRWLLGMLQAGLQVPIYELPTIPGVVPGLAASFIDDGMRGGIPKEDWASVVTVYDDAEQIARFTGDEGRRRNARVLVLDADGVVRFFQDRGYSARLMLELAALAGTATASVAIP